MNPLQVIFFTSVAALGFLQPGAAQQNVQHPMPNPGEASPETLKMTLLIRRLALDKYDGSGTGVLSDEDKKRLMDDARDAGRAAKEAFIKRFDKDGDGKLSREEFEAFKAEVDKRRGHGAPQGNRMGRGHGHGRAMGGRIGPQPHAGRGPAPMVEFRTPGQKRFRVAPGLFLLTRNLFMAAYDKDGDGKVSPQEHALAVKDAEALYQASMAELIERYDLDKDGKLSYVEREQALAESRRDSPLSGIEEPDDIDLFIRANLSEVLLDEAPESESDEGRAPAAEPGRSGEGQE